MKIFRPFLQILIISTMVLSLGLPASAGKLQKQLIAESTIETISKRGVLRVGMSTFVPWAMKDKTGKFIGFEIDVATRLAKDTGVVLWGFSTRTTSILKAWL